MNKHEATNIRIRVARLSFVRSHILTAENAENAEVFSFQAAGIAGKSPYKIADKNRKNKKPKNIF